MLKMDLEYEDEIFFIRLNGTLNKNNTHKINNYIVPVIKKHKIKNVLINIKGLKKIDSSGINAILNIKCITRINKGKVYLCGVNKELNESLKILKLKNLLSENSLLKRIEV